ncbi:hypothetical protein N007_18250 [Alicyclobacillus acidoterrestris ATCC 49025]|nr:hypothetical protein N007_18250 [Alicyclobacillus acidoterrestris ATCC 49025]
MYKYFDFFLISQFKNFFLVFINQRLRTTLVQLHDKIPIYNIRLNNRFVKQFDRFN